MHTTASDGRCTPEQLIDEAVAVGLSVLAVTDHDTTASTVEIRDLAGTRGIETIPGIEITAVEHQKDVHVLGYFHDITHPPLVEFLARGRGQRLGRMHQIAEKLSALGAPIDVEPLLAQAAKGRAIGRPQIAQALQEAGHVKDVFDAFEKYLAGDRPAFVPRTGAPVKMVIDVIHEAGGLVSLAHPGLTKIDQRILELREVGLDALEVYHPGHDAEAVERYEAMAADYGLLITAGSDYHGDPAMRPLGGTTLPAEAWDRLREGRRSYA